MAGLGGPAQPSPTLPTPAPAASAAAPRPLPAVAGDGLYLSLGDSYAAGTTPGSYSTGRTSGTAFPYQVSGRVPGLQLVNLACSGATSGDVLSAPGCASGLLGPGSTPYPTQPQLAAAEAVLAANPGRVRLVTIVIGGNDATRCLDTTDAAGDFRTNPATVSCLGSAMIGLGENLGQILARVRALVGPDVPIVGLTYPDSYLGLYTRTEPGYQDYARASQPVFEVALNPALRAAYAGAGASFVDITALTGGYDALDPAPGGALPVPVQTVCRLTYMCSDQDVHATDAGHTFIADQVLAATPG